MPQRDYKSGWIFISNSLSQSETLKIHSIKGKMYDVMVNATIDSFQTFNTKDRSGSEDGFID